MVEWFICYIILWISFWRHKYIPGKLYITGCSWIYHFIWHVFDYNLCSNVDSDIILVSTPMFLSMRNQMVTLLHIYECWFTQNSKWLPLKLQKSYFWPVFTFNYIEALRLHYCNMWFIFLVVYKSITMILLWYT